MTRVEKAVLVERAERILASYVCWVLNPGHYNTSPKVAEDHVAYWRDELAKLKKRRTTK